jgi:hypothetical protein
MAKPDENQPDTDDSKVVYIRVSGKTATRWRKLLREEGGTEQHHGLSAIEDYIEKKGYDKEPTTPTK